MSVSFLPIEVINLLRTIAIVLLVLWLLGFIGFHAIGGFIHILLVAAIIIFLFDLLSGSRTRTI